MLVFWDTGHKNAGNGGNKGDVDSSYQCILLWTGRNWCAASPARIGQAHRGFSAMGTELSADRLRFHRFVMCGPAKRVAAFAAVLMIAGATVAGAQTPTPATTPQLPAQSSAANHDIVGIWQGTLHIPQADQHPQIDLRLVVKISKTDAGALKAEWYSIDQSGRGLPMATISFQDGVLKFKSSMIERSYEGKMSEDGKSIAGTWMEGTMPIVLPLERASPDTAWAIPEPPKPMAADANPGFDVATIKPSQPGRPGKGIGFNGHEFIARNFDMYDLIAFAYGMHTKQIIGAQDWFDKDLFDIAGTPDVAGVPSLHQMELMVQKLLPDRFALKFHHEQRELPVYIITVAPGGPKTAVTKSGPNDPQPFFFRAFGDLTVGNMTITEFATWMQASVMDRPVVDHTGLTDRYDFHLKWTPDESQFAQWRSSNGPIQPPAGDNPNAAPSLYTAMQEQLGLKMEAGKAMDDVIVIDHVEKPSPN
jgi:uncharacterized protein (TIGR03435 family)